MSNINFNNGFYPALGTPTNEDGVLVTGSFSRQIELMIGSGASGMLCMGSMGRMESLRNSEYPKVAKKCVDITRSRVPVLVGVMDCSIARVLDRIDSLGNIDIDGVVTTLPYYLKVSESGAINFFSLISRKSRFPVFIYDLPSVTQTSVTPYIMSFLKDEKNIKGMKTPNLNLILDLKRNNLINEDFHIFYSALDTFDLAISGGIRKNLDGMFTCTPVNSGLMYSNIETGNGIELSGYLRNIIRLRNLFLKEDVLASYSFAMELLGCPGIYHCDYSNPASTGLREEIYNCMKEIKEI